MHYYIIRIAWGSLGAILIALVAYVAFWVMGSAVVLDRSGQITSAIITTGGGPKQALHALPFGVFYTVPQFEGSIEVRCRDGSHQQYGYVTGHFHTWLRLEVGQSCQEIEEIS
jgi:hypothetical protein